MLRRSCVLKALGGGVWWAGSTGALTAMVGVLLPGRPSVPGTERLAGCSVARIEHRLETLVAGAGPGGGPRI